MGFWSAAASKILDGMTVLKVSLFLRFTSETSINDKYLETDDLESLAVDLSSIGEFLAQRFESEDKMIEVLHNAHVPALLQESQADSV